MKACLNSWYHKTTTIMKGLVFACSLALLITFVVSRKSYSGGITEETILEEYEKRGHTFPPANYIPNTPGWKALIDRRFAQLRQLDQYRLLVVKNFAWIETLRAGVTFANFTEYGWGVTRVKDDLIQTLVKEVEEGLPTAEKEWESNPNSALLIHRPDLMKRVQEELKLIMEAWTGIDLLPTHFVGLRVVRNNATELMHSEAPNTRALACILQVASSPKSAKPWPIAVEDFEGNTNLVRLTSGDVLMLESSKLHFGRPLPFAGDWTTAVVAYFVPHDPLFENIEHDMEANFALPATWREVPEKEDDFPEVQIVGMSWTEPSCPYKWCALKDAISWQGPAEVGSVLTTGKTRRALKPDRDEL